MALALLLVVPLLSDTKVSSPILRAPAAQAAREKKLIFVSFSASWCGPCRLMHKVLESPKLAPVWHKYFVDSSVIVDENADKASLNTPGGNELRIQLGGEKEGIPFWAFLKPDGTVLETSLMKGPGTNIGCPMTADEINSFVAKLTKSVPKMSAADRGLIESEFKGANQPAATAVKER